jgi:hypothetical protein
LRERKRRIEKKMHRGGFIICTPHQRLYGEEIQRINWVGHAVHKEVGRISYEILGAKF